MTGSGERYRQVWRSWLRWPIFRAASVTVAVWWVAWVVWFISIFTRSHAWWAQLIWHVSGPLSFFVKATPVLFMVCLPMMIVWRVKSQMQDWRGALLPGFKPPHLRVSAAIATIFFVLLDLVPIAAESTLRWVSFSRQRLEVPQIDQALYQQAAVQLAMFLVRDGIYGSAVVLSMAAITGWLFASFSLWLGAAIVAGLIFLYVGFEWDVFLRFPDFRSALEQNIYLDIAFFALTLPFLVGLWARLEDMTADDQTVAADDRLPWLASILNGTPPLSPGSLLTAALRERVAHRRLVGLGHRFIWIVAILLAAMTAMSPLLSAGINHWLIDDGYAFAALCAAAAISALTIGLSWPQRFADLREVELLRPAAAPDFAREIGLAMLSDSAEICLATLLAMFVPIAFWSPSSLQSLPFWDAAGAAILCQLLVFGSLAWTMGRFSAASSLVVVLVAVVILEVLIYQALQQRTLIYAIFAAGVGILLAAKAYRRCVRGDMI